MSPLYVKLLSVHVLADGDVWPARTLCGRVPSVAAPVLAEIPGTGRTCETCLRLQRRHEDAASRIETPQPGEYPTA